MARRNTVFTEMLNKNVRIWIMTEANNKNRRDAYTIGIESRLQLLQRQQYGKKEQLIKEDQRAGKNSFQLHTKMERKMNIKGPAFFFLHS